MPKLLASLREEQTLLHVSFNRRRGRLWHGADPGSCHLSLQRVSACADVKQNVEGRAGDRAAIRGPSGARKAAGYAFA
jgi:hypothetical protein